MAAIGVVLTGTRGAGKTTVADRLVEMGLGYVTVSAVTTRSRRSDDLPGAFDYLSDEVFTAAKLDGELVVSSYYAGNSYGIRRTTLASAIASGAHPVLTITPESAHRFLTSLDGALFIGVFLDGDNDLLDCRILQRDGSLGAAINDQRGADRGYCTPPIMKLINDRSVESAATQINLLRLQANP